MVDNLKNTIIKKIKSKVDIPVKDNLLEDSTELENIKFLIKNKIDDNKIEVISYDMYDVYGKEIHPEFSDVNDLVVKIGESKFNVINYREGILDLEGSLEGVDIHEHYTTLEIVGKVNTEKLEDYIYVSSLHAFNKRLNATTNEYYRRFEIGVFVYNDPCQNKCRKYLKQISSAINKDFNIIDDEGKNIDYAYIFNPMKFDVEENGKLNRVLYGSIMLKTIEINFN